MHTKSLMKSGIALLAAGLSFVSLAWTVRPGLQMARTGATDGDAAHFWTNYELTYEGKDVFEASQIPLEMVPGALIGDINTSWTNPWTGNTHSWDFYTLFSYRGQVYLEKDVEYGFGECIDDGAQVVINDTVVISDCGCYYSIGTYTPAYTGWHDIDIRICNLGGACGPQWWWVDYGMGLAWCDHNAATRENYDGHWHHVTIDDGLQLRYLDENDAVVVTSAEKTASGYSFTLKFADPAMVGKVSVALDDERKVMEIGGDAAGWDVVEEAGIDIAGGEATIAIDWDGATAPYVAILGRNKDGVEVYEEFTSSSPVYAISQLVGRGMTAEPVTGEDNAIVSINLGFEVVPDTVTNTLYVAYGSVAGGDELSSWEHYEKVAVIPSSTTSYSYTMPAEWGHTLFAMRFFLRDGVYRHLANKLVSPAGARYRLGYVPTLETRATIKTTIKTQSPSKPTNTYTVEDALFTCEGSMKFGFFPVAYESQFRYDGLNWIYNYNLFGSARRPYVIEAGIAYFMLDGNWMGGEIRSDWQCTEFDSPLVLYSDSCIGDLYYFRLREQEDGGAAFADTYFDDGTATAYFVPAVDIDGKSCLYDTIGGHFVYNSGNSDEPRASGFADDLFFTGGVVDRSEVFTLNDPYVANPPAITYDADNGFAVSVTLDAGKGDVEVIYDDGAYSQVLGTGLEGPVDLKAAIPALPSGTSHSFAVVTKSNGKTVATIPSPMVVYTDTPTISLGTTAVSKNFTPGSFKVSRKDAYGDLYVNYTVGGTAVDGSDFERLDGVVVIRSGSTSADIVINPKWGPSSAVNSTIEITLAPGAYIMPATAPSATMTLAPSTKAFAGKGYRKFFNIMTTGYDGEAQLDNFPMLVRISESLIDGFSYADVDGDDGYGLQFRDEKGLVLDYEIDTWDIDGESLVWVSVPKLNGSDTVIRCFYSLADDEAVIPEVASSNVWLKAQYIAVYHMNMAEGETYALDSAGNGLDAYSPSGVQREGVVGLARDNGILQAINGGPQIRIPCYDDLIPTEKTSAVSHTVSGWFKASSSGQSNARIFSSKDYNWSDVGWSVEFPNCNVIYLRGHNESSGNFQTAGPDVSKDWVRYDFAFDDVYATVYTNGYPIVTNAGTEQETTRFYTDGVGQSQYGLWVGGCNASTGGEPSFGGKYDEVRIRKVVSNDAWVKAEYDTIMKSDYLTYSAALDATNGGPGLIIYIR